MKTCTQCGETKSYDCFYRMSASKDGYMNECKECNSARRSQWYRDNKDHHIRHNKKYRRENLEKHRKYCNEYNHREDVKIKISKRKKEHYKNNKEKYKARNKVWVAIQKNKLPRIEDRICEDCGAVAQEYHHEDYSKPLEVIPLCKLCHVDRHY